MKRLHFFAHVVQQHTTYMYNNIGGDIHIHDQNMRHDVFPNLHVAQLHIYIGQITTKQSITT